MMDGLRAGQVAAAAGVNRQTLRYYERRGLLAEPARTLGGHRIYPPDAVTAIRMIKAAQRLGFTLDEVADLLTVGTARRRAPLDGGLRTRAVAKLDQIEARIADLLTIRDTLRLAVGAGCDNLRTCLQTPECPLSTPSTEPGRRT